MYFVNPFQNQFSEDINLIQADSNVYNKLIDVQYISNSFTVDCQSKLMISRYKTDILLIIYIANVMKQMFNT